MTKRVDVTVMIRWAKSPLELLQAHFKQLTEGMELAHLRTGPRKVGIFCKLIFAGLKEESHVNAVNRIVSNLGKIPIAHEYIKVHDSKEPSDGLTDHIPEPVSSLPRLDGDQPASSGDGEAGERPTTEPST